MIKNESYVVLGGWMPNNLKLKGNDLIAYATIYSFTNGTDDHCFKGSASYIGERCGIDKRSALRVLQRLEDKGFIFRKERIENGVKFVDYYTDTNVIGGDKMSLGGGDKLSPHNDSIDKDSSKKTKSLSLNNSLNVRLTNICKGGLTFSDNVIERLEEYNNTRSKKLEKLTDKGFKLVIDKLVKYGKGTEEGMIAVLKQSIENGWEGLFEVKGLKPKVDYENDLGLFLNKMKTNYEGLKQELGKEKFFELKKKALEYGAENKLL